MLVPRGRFACIDRLTPGDDAQDRVERAIVDAEACKTMRKRSYRPHSLARGPAPFRAPGLTIAASSSIPRSIALARRLSNLLRSARSIL